MLGDHKAIERLYQVYDGKIHFVDRYVGQILNHLQTLGLRDNTLAFLTSDYDTDLHVPFIAAGPGIPEGKAIPGLSSNVDSAPTILSLAELPPLSHAEGHSLKPMIDGDTESLNQYVYADEDVAIPMRSVRDLHYNLVLNLWMGKEQFFGEEQDPKELTNAAAKHPDIVKELDLKLRACTSSASGNFAGGCFWTEQGDGSRTAVWCNDDPMIGNCEVSIYSDHPVIGRLATNAPFTIMTASGQQTVCVNFNNSAGQWHLLGTVENPRYVKETNAANGAIVVDAVRFTRLTP